MSKGHQSADFLIEAKLSIPSNKILEEVKTQARGYANLPKAKYSIIAAKDTATFDSKDVVNQMVDAIAVYTRIVMHPSSSKLEPNAHTPLSTFPSKCIQAPLRAACPTAIAVYTRGVMHPSSSKLEPDAHTPLCTSQCNRADNRGQNVRWTFALPDRSEAETLNLHGIPH